MSAIQQLMAGLSSGVATWATFGAEVQVAADMAGRLLSCPSAAAGVRFIAYSSFSTGEVFVVKVTVGSGTVISSISAPASLIAAANNSIRGMHQIAGTSSFLFIYSVGTTSLHAVVVDFSGTTPTKGATTTVATGLGTANEGYISSVVLNASGSQALVSYFAGGVTTYALLSVSGTSVSVAATLSGANIGTSSLSRLSDTAVVEVYATNGSSLSARTISISGATIALNSTSLLYTESALTPQLAQIAPSRFVCSWGDSGQLASTCLLSVSAGVVSASNKSGPELVPYNARGFAGPIKTDSLAYVGATSDGRIAVHEADYTATGEKLDLIKAAFASRSVNNLSATLIDTSRVLLSYSRTSDLRPASLVVSIQ